MGGVTRLTESGLSMTSWHLIKDISKPMCEEDWQREFDIYKTFPEYEAVHSDMTLEGMGSNFKIYIMSNDPLLEIVIRPH